MLHAQSMLQDAAVTSCLGMHAATALDERTKAEAEVVRIEDVQGQGWLGSVHGFQALLATVPQAAVAEARPAGPKGPDPALLALQQAVADGRPCIPAHVHRIIPTTPEVHSAPPHC